MINVADVLSLHVQVEESDAVEPREQLTVSQWAAQRRILSKKESRYSGPWSNNLCPYLVEPMDCLSDMTTREVWMKKCAQSAGTECGHNWLGQTVDEDPSPMLLIMPDENLAKKELRTRIKPMFESTPSLLRHLRGNEIRNLNIGQESELDRMFLYIGWAGSAVAMSSTPIRKIIIDEAAKCQMTVGMEADPYNLLRDRQKTYSDISKIFAPSTPILAGDAFDREYQTTDMRELWLKCPFCHQYHIGKLDYLEMDHDSVGHLLTPHDYLEPKCSRYICPRCHKKWSEWDRWQAVTSGEWAPHDCKVEDGKIVGTVFNNPMRGYRISSFMIYPGFITCAKIAYEWAKSEVDWKSGIKKTRQNFINSWLGEDWIEKEKVTDEAKLVTHIGSHEPATVPAGCQMITVGIDVQQDHVWYAILGWGYLSECWLITDGRLETGDTKQISNYFVVESLLHSAFQMESDPDKMMSITLAGVDCGYVGDVVIDFCRRCSSGNAIPVKGSGLVRHETYSTAPVLGGAMKRYDLNVNNIKNRLYRLLYDTTEPGPGYLHLHKQISKDTMEQLASEQQTPIKVGHKLILAWTTKSDYRANHLWDCCVYATAVAEIAGARMLRPLINIEPKALRTVKRPGFLSDLPSLHG